MGNQQFFAEALLAGRRDDFNRHTCELTIIFAVCRGEYERYESWPWFLDFQSKLTGKIVAEAGGAYFRDRKPAGSDDEHRRSKLHFAGAQDKFGGASDFAYLRLQKDLDIRDTALFQEHVKDLARGAVAKKLAERLLVIGDAM